MNKIYVYYCAEKNKISLYPRKVKVFVISYNTREHEYIRNEYRLIGRL